LSDSLNLIQIDRRWFLTWTTYGTWLPGDERGFVGTETDGAGQTVTHNEFGTQPGKANKLLRHNAKQLMTGEPIILNLPQARTLFEQFQETACHRGWLLIAIGIMHTHLHLIVGVPGDPDPEKILGDFKAYGSRCLNQGWGKPANETWWTTNGSKRKLDDDLAVETVVHYVRNQPNSLLVWTRADGFLVGGAGL
jgi:REP element-mobilizing transposase RayT